MSGNEWYGAGGKREALIEDAICGGNHDDVLDEAYDFGEAVGRAAGLREAADLVLGGDLEVTRVQLADLLRARAEGVDR